MLNTRKSKIRLWKNKVIFWVMMSAMPFVLLLLFPVTYVMSIIKAAKILKIKIIASEDPCSGVCNNITLPESYPDNAYTDGINGKMMH